MSKVFDHFISFACELLGLVYVVIGVSIIYLTPLLILFGIRELLAYLFGRDIVNISILSLSALAVIIILWRHTRRV